MLKRFSLVNRGRPHEAGVFARQGNDAWSGEGSRLLPSLDRGAGGRGFGLDVQREAVEEFCRSQSLDLIETFIDPGVSGSTPLVARSGLAGALARVKAGDAAVLVAARYDRLARDALEALLIEREFTAAGGRVLYASGANGDEDAMRLMRTVLHGIAEFEKRQLVARLAAARKAKVARGGYGGGRPPFGYEGRAGQLHVRRDLQR